MQILFELGDWHGIKKFLKFFTTKWNCMPNLVEFSESYGCVIRGTPFVAK